MKTALLPSTRQRVEQLLLAEGPATAAGLAARLDLTVTGVRRHLDAMVAGGVLLARDPRPVGVRGRGRPARVYELSAHGHARAPHAYDELATDLLQFLAGRGDVAEFAEIRAAHLESRYASTVSGTRELALALTQDGYAATVHSVASGTQICQHHCPVALVAERFPQLCDAETAAIGRVLGTHVQRLATIAHGDGVCTTHVPHAERGTPDLSPQDPHRQDPQKGS